MLVLFLKRVIKCMIGHSFKQNLDKREPLISQVDDFILYCTLTWSLSECDFVVDLT